MMIYKILKLIYILIVATVGILALALGAANSSEVLVNLWAVKINTSLAAVMSVSAIIGAVFISLCWVYVCLKLRINCSVLTRRLKQMEQDSNVNSVVVQEDNK